MPFGKARAKPRKREAWLGACKPEVCAAIPSEREAFDGRARRKTDMIIKYLSPDGLRKLFSKMKAAFSEKNHNHQLSDLSGTVPVSKGGTGATAAAQARTNLGVTPANIGAAPASHTHDAGNIASGLIPIVRGGTGGSTPAAARQNLGITPQNIGAMPTTGGAFTGPVSFDGSTIGLRWTTANGTTFSVRPHTSGNLFQITAEGPNTGDIEYGMFNIEDNGDIWLENALSVNSGGTGAKDAAGARQNLGITPENIGALPASGGTMTDSIWFEGNTVGLVWETANGTVFSLRPYAPGNVFQITTGGPNTGNAEQPTFDIHDDGHLHLYHALPIDSGGTGASSALGAAVNLGLSDPDEMDFVATDATDWENQVKAHILDRIQDRRCMMFTAGWSGRGFGSGLAWKAAGNVYVLIFNQEATQTLKFWFYTATDQSWRDIGIG